MTIQSVTTGFYKGYTLTDLEECILWELGQVVGSSVSYNKFPQSQIRKKLTHRQNQFVSESQCIKKFALIKGKADFRQYKLPVNCMEDGLISVKWYETSETYEKIELVDQRFMDENHDGYLIEESSEPEYCWIGDSYGNIPTIEVHPAPDEDGDDYSDNTDTGVVVGTDLPERADDVTGQATGGDGTTLTDSGASFTTDGLTAGMYVRNVTDGSYGYILSIAATSITLAAELTGGTSNEFAAGDSYQILASEYGVLVSWDEDDRYLFGSDPQLLSTITVPGGNFRVDYVPYPPEFPASGSNLMYPVIPKIYHYDLAMAVVGDFLKTFKEDTGEFKRAQLYLAIWQNALERGASKRKSRPFADKQVRIRPRFR